MKRRFVLVNYHIFKNAGTTIEWILERNFGNALRVIDEPGERGVIPNSELLRMIRKEPHLQALSSHHFRLPAPKHERYRFLEICLVRHPLDRLQSIYHFYRRRQGVNEPVDLKAQQSSLPEFLTWLLENRPFEIINPQTCIMGNHGRYFFPPAPRHLDRAIACMQELAVTGIVERFDDTLLVAERFLTPVFPQLDLSYVPQNARPDRNTQLSDRLDEIRAECGARLFAELVKCSDLDMELFKATEAELDRRLQSVRNVDSRRANFDARRASLADWTKLNIA